MQDRFYTFSFSAAQTTSITLPIQQNGLVGMINIDVQANTNSVTSEIVIKDKRGYTVYDSGAQPAGQVFRSPNALTGVQAEEIPVDYAYTITCSISGAPGAGGATTNVTLYIKRNKEW